MGLQPIVRTVPLAERIAALERWHQDYEDAIADGCEPDQAVWIADHEPRKPNQFFQTFDDPVSKAILEAMLTPFSRTSQFPVPVMTQPRDPGKKSIG